MNGYNDFKTQTGPLANGEAETGSVFAPKGDSRKKKKRGKSQMAQEEDPFAEKKKKDRRSRSNLKSEASNKDMMKPRAEAEMDLIDEQSKKKVAANKSKYEKSGLEAPNQTKYFVDPEGFVKFPDGSRFKGALLDGNPSGMGIIIYGDGSRYEGNWTGGNANGQGILTFADLSRYEGEWYKGKYHGQGTFTTPDDAKYSGGWFAGRYHGVGEFKWPEGSVYRGEWKNCR